MDQKLVTVIIPVFNVEKYVEKALTSIVNQTYRNLEIIVIDDGSTDDTYSIVEGLKNQDQRILLVKNEYNIKIVKTLNRGLEMATGEYIARMDGDDISKIDRIEKKVEFLESNPQFDLVGCSLIAIDLEDKEIGRALYSSNQDLLRKNLHNVTPVSHVWVARKTLYDKMTGYREIPGVEDYDFLLRMTSSGYSYTNLEGYYGYYVRLGREGNTISRFGLKQIKMHDYVIKLYKDRIKKGKDDFNEKHLDKYVKSNMINQYLHTISSECLFQAIKWRKQKKYVVSIIFLFLTLISPYQIKYLYKRFLYRLNIIKFHKL